ncbi:MAG: aldo/keto reductase, partial [Rhizobiaceae bacterium]
ALQFPLHHPVVCSVIPGPRSKTELAEILEWAAADIPQAFWSDLCTAGLIHENAPLIEGNPYF